MFTDLELKHSYHSSEDITQVFFIPVLQEAIRYDRVSAYFDAQSLAACARGLQPFVRAGHHVRLVVSQDIGAADLEAMKQGYALRDSLCQELVESLRQRLTLEVDKGLANLAHLIAIGTLDIKIAFKRQGIVHDKFGILEDAAGNRISFTGSNNETGAALQRNHESFHSTISWLDQDGYYEAGIDKDQQLFDEFWAGGFEDIVVREVDGIVLKEILSHDTGKIYEEGEAVMEDACVLDLRDDRLVLDMSSLADKGESILRRSVFKVRLRPYLYARRTAEGGLVRFSTDLSYVDYKKVDVILQKGMKREGVRYLMTERLKRYIEEKDIYIRERATLGLDIKRRDPRVLEGFEHFREIVNRRLDRKLRDRQMWDAFFMMMMIKSGNFSVPGSGKTSSVLGMFAYLQEAQKMQRIVMIGPKNAFGSWIDEFKACFGTKQELACFDIHDASLESSRRIKADRIRYGFDNYNLLLFNYEIIARYEDEIKEVVQQEDTLLVFDEVHKVKSIRGERADHALEIAKVAHQLTVMTGTPIPNGYRDVYNMLNIMFPNEYSAFFGYDPSLLTDPTEAEKQDINRKLQPFYCRTTKQDLKVTPANADKILDVVADVTMSRIFQMLTQAYRKGNHLLWFLRVLQLESDPTMLVDAVSDHDLASVIDVDVDDIEDIKLVDYGEEFGELIQQLPSQSPKLIRCLDQIERLVGEGKSVVCWTIFRKSLWNIQQGLEKRGIDTCCIYGDVLMEDRQERLAAFKAGRDKVLVTNPHTLAESVSLHGICHDAVYFEYSYNLVHLLQSKDRIHRLGLPDGQYTQYYFLREHFNVSGQMISLAEAVYQRLQEKERLMLRAIDDSCLEDETTSDEDLEMLFNQMHGKMGS